MQPRVFAACAAVLLTLAACEGLRVDAGNAFPCDFSAPPAERDLVCNAGDVCGLDNLCRKYLYEGPRFEGAPSLIADDAGLKVHPLVLDTGVTLLARDLLGQRLLARLESGTTVALNAKGQVLPAPRLDDELEQLTVAALPGTTFAAGVGLTRTGHVKVAVAGAPLRAVREAGSLAAELEVAALRVQPSTVAPAQPAQRRPILVQFIGRDGSARAVVDAGLPDLRPTAPVIVETLAYPIDAGAGPALDVLRLDRQGAPPSVAVLQARGLSLEQPDGRFELVATHDEAQRGSLRLNAASTLLAATRGTALRDVLSTWQVGVSQGGQVLEPAWPDCTPCRAGRDATDTDRELLELATPRRVSDGLGVEVVCFSLRRQTRSLLLVTGSTAVEPTDRCTTEALPLPVDASRVATVDGRLVTSAGQRGLELGGRDGQVWRGETPSGLLPTALERVPRDVTTVRVATSDGEPLQPMIAVLTDRYLAAYQPAVGLQLQNGFRRVVVDEDFGNTDDALLASAIHGIPGWGVLTSGVVVRVVLDARELDRDGGIGRSPIDFGPRLVTPAGDPIRGSAGGEAWVETDGGVTSFFVAADDGLYFVPSPPGTLSPVPTGSATMTPQLQPEPSVPIRSFALERTPLGTDGRTKARGYLVTSRNVFEWSLGGTPSRWSARPLVLAGEEPLEVWFDKPRSALGRVGYTSGQIFTLPGGYQLTETLPKPDDDRPVKVLDYENLGGWPVALTTSGLYAADWGPLVNGVVQNKFADGRPNKPMTWRELTLAGGARPWVVGGEVRSGKLFVSVAPAPGGEQLHTLYLFLDTQVWLVATHLRKP